MEESQTIIEAPPRAEEPKARRQKHKFTPEEDELIRQFVVQHGVNQWDAVAKALEHRTPRQCRDRWKHYLSPHVSHNEFTIDEDKNLIHLCMTLGPQWSALTKFFPGRTDVNLKNRWNKLQRNYRKLNGEGMDEAFAAHRKSEQAMAKQQQLLQESGGQDPAPQSSSSAPPAPEDTYDAPAKSGFYENQENGYVVSNEDNYEQPSNQ